MNDYTIDELWTIWHKEADAAAWLGCESWARYLAPLSTTSNKRDILASLKCLRRAVAEYIKEEGLNG
jgi:hypothetical protein